MTEKGKENSQEKDYLVYAGNRIPRVIRFVWTILVIFCVYYLWRFALPDLTQWISKL